MKSGQIKCKLDAKGTRRTHSFVCLRWQLSQCLLKVTLMQMRGGTVSASLFHEFRNFIGNISHNIHAYPTPSGVKICNLIEITTGLITRKLEYKSDK